MKKNIVGHMTTPREGAFGRLKRLGIFPKLVCLLLALLVWLLIFNVVEQKALDLNPTARMTETAGLE